MENKDPSSDDIAFLKKFVHLSKDAPIVFKKAPPLPIHRNPRSPMRFFAKGFDAKKDRKETQIERLVNRAPLTKADIDRIMAPLDALIGQKKVKNHIRLLLTNLEFQRLRAIAGLAPRSQQLHMVFAGPPGSGKTTMAKIIAKILFESGFAETDKFREVKRADLIGEYIGETERRTMRILEETKGGVLFIDEAYALSACDSGRDFGHRVIETLVAQMDKPDFGTIVICAGYEGAMRSFLASNEGLRSRFSNILHFETYTARELAQIAEAMTEDAEYHLTDESREKIAYVLKNKLRQGEMTDGGARIVRHLIDETILHQAKRVLSMQHANLRDLVIIEPQDIPGQGPALAGDVADNKIISFGKRS